MSFLARMIASAVELSFGGPLGALLDRIAEHITHRHGHGHGQAHGDGHDTPNGDPKRRVAFTMAAIALSAKMARVDGDVTGDEVTAFHEVFQIPPGEEEHVRLVFDLARKSTHGFESYARQIGRLLVGDRLVLEHLLDGLFHIALADGRLRAAEDAYLREVAHHFGLTASDYARIRAHHIPSKDSVDDSAYAILGLAPGASVAEIRLAYHRLVRETHPDLAIAQGLPPECVKLATARIARINAAYDALARSRPVATATG